MATIVQRTRANGKHYYTATVRVTGSPSKSASFDRKTDAKEWAQSLEASIKERRYFPNRQAERRTLAEAIDRYKAENLAGLKDGRNRERHLEYFRERYGLRRLAEITPEVLGEWRTTLAIGRKPATVNRTMAAIRRVLSLASGEWEWMVRNPGRGVSKLTEPTGRVRFLNDGERAALLTACRESASPLLYPLVLTALSTGARRGELLGLRWSDVDLTRRVIILRDTKNTETRAVPLTGPAFDELRKLQRRRAAHSDFVFPHPSRDRPFEPRDEWARAVTKAEITDFRFHDLRHCTASYLAMAGASTAEIADVLGHKTLQMVKRYAHLSEQHTAGVLSRMTAKVLGGGS